MKVATLGGSPYLQRQTIAQDCQPRDYGWGSFVCVCNAHHCDFIGDIGDLPSGEVVVFESSKAGLRFAKTTAKFSETTGIEYNMGRIPLASTDFSERKYTYDDSPDDFELENFTLASEDLDLKMPHIQKAMSFSSDVVWFIGSSWSSPAWMKTNGELEGLGFLKGLPGGPYYKTWAKYHIRFIQEYEKQGVPIWGLTTQNEPTSGFVPFYPWQTLGFTACSQRDFITLDLGPALEHAGYGAGKVKVMIFDDNRLFLPLWANLESNLLVLVGKILSDHEAAKYVHGVGVHWYQNKFVGPAVLDHVRQNFPDKFILATEACSGYEITTVNKVKLGSWDRAEEYASDIIENLNHGVGGWIDWNLVLDTEGGPTWANNYVGSPIIANATAEEFYKQPTYYAMGHFRQNRKVMLRIQDQSNPVNIQKVISERSIATFIWKADSPCPT
ncbi:hypothetical protein HPB51_013816 [Rhipicephalus microplus]|uniref:Glucosylceramidase n=1 Tax=Rhipicephalus microplus TaxID=6941 RepID=A0A9J6F3M5_RHIMP|nr:hypothetical protein HPB51_013816 [Rhipicephalus microplus]